LNRCDCRHFYAQIAHQFQKPYATAAGESMRHGYFELAVKLFCSMTTMPVTT